MACGVEDGGQKKKTNQPQKNTHPKADTDHAKINHPPDTLPSPGLGVWGVPRARRPAGGAGGRTMSGRKVARPKAGPGGDAPRWLCTFSAWPAALPPRAPRPAAPPTRRRPRLLVWRGSARLAPPWAVRDWRCVRAPTLAHRRARLSVPGMPHPHPPRVQKGAWSRPAGYAATPGDAEGDGQQGGMNVSALAARAAGVCWTCPRALWAPAVAVGPDLFGGVADLGHIKGPLIARRGAVASLPCASEPA